MDKWELERRTKRFALRVIRFVSSLNSTTVTRVMGYQLMKAGASIDANYREVNQTVSRADFLNKIGIATKEAVETQYWTEFSRKLVLAKPKSGNGFCKNPANSSPSLVASAKQPRAEAKFAILDHKFGIPFYV